MATGKNITTKVLGVLIFDCISEASENLHYSVLTFETGGNMKLCAPDGDKKHDSPG